ncbi:hypothetical protein JIN84_17305 [Luteolibacter yonseiensis]|uniref:Uncharacterized protein n=2 Tax=Luteolibacter yonseiensis TaxID=1144680 RepID=A0A934R708_9BACT|nr:hypothetical protein [Luteolibacter yonseiensis]MBK1817381.1 hypothetical protein [Luteolibacter yonseiensis]
MIPAAAGPIRVCFLEHGVHEGFTSYGETSNHKLKCCPDCGKDGESCCMDVEGLPHTPEASQPRPFPPTLFFELPSLIVAPVCPIAEIEPAFVPGAPIRGPDKPGLRRALLEIWNI